MTDTIRAFIEKWEQNTQKESAAAKEHFVDLCHVLRQKTPNDRGSGPDSYCFEKSLTKTGGKAGFADVWKKDRFAWEYKGKGKYPTLDAAYQQLLLYKEDLDNPPVLVACDIANYEVHIAFTGYRTHFDAYGWPHGPSDDEILARLLALNLKRAAGQGEVVVVAVEEECDDEE